MEAKPESDLVAILKEKQEGSVSVAAEWTLPEELIDGYGDCAICLEKIKIQEAAIVKGCEHAYCTICILRWATYKGNPSCPQCKKPFEFLNVHRSLDGRIHEYMFEESVCLLLRAAWFVPLMVEAQGSTCEEEEVILQYYILQYYYDLNDEHYDDDVDDDELIETYLTRASSSIQIGNRSWGDNGYVRAGRKEARPLDKRSSKGYEASSSRRPKSKEVLSDAPPTGRRAKRALKREAAAAKHQQFLQRLGRNFEREAAHKAAAAKHQQLLQRLGRNFDRCITNWATGEESPQERSC